MPDSIRSASGYSNEEPPASEHGPGSTSDHEPPTSINRNSGADKSHSNASSTAVPGQPLSYKQAVDGRTCLSPEEQMLLLAWV